MFAADPVAVAALPPPAQAALPAPRRVTLTGGGGTLIRHGAIEDLDPNRDVRGDKWYGTPNKLGIAQQMTRDPHVRRSLVAISAPLRAALWDFEPASRSPLDVEAAAFARFAFFERLDWDTFLRQALNYKRDGFSLFEVTSDIAPIAQDRFPLHPGKGSGWLYTGLHYRPANTVYGWHQNPANPLQLASVTQWLPGSDAEPSGQRSIPADWLIRFTEDQEGSNFAGLACLRSAYGAWKIKLTLLILDSIRHERQGVGTPTIKLPNGATDDEIDIARTILSEMRAHEKGFLLLKDGFEFSWSTYDGTGTNITEAIERCNRDIAFNVGAGFMLLGLSGSTGSYALAQSQSGQYELSLEGDARFIASVLNIGVDGWSPVGRLIEANYGAAARPPRLVARNMPTRDWSKLLPTLNNLILSGAIRPDEELEDFLRLVMFLPRRDPDTARAVATGVAAAMTGVDTQSDLQNSDAQPSDPSTADAPATDAPIDPAVEALTAGGGSVQDTALNGAQVDSALSIIDRVVDGRFPRDSATAQLRYMFNLKPDAADEMLGEIGQGWTPAPPPGGNP